MNGTRDLVWVSAHLHFHDDLDDLLRQAVRPLLDELRRDGSLVKWFYLRYWNGGPHLRLRLLVPAAAEPDTRAAIAAAARARIEHSPSPTAMTEAEYAQWAHELSRLERTPAIPLVPDNSLLFVPYQPEHHRYGVGRQLAAVEQHFTESSEIALRVVQAQLPRQHRIALGVSAVSAIYSWNDTPAWALAEAVSESVRRDFDTAYEAQRDPLCRLMRRWQDRDADGAAAPGVEEAWWASASRLRARLTAPDPRVCSTPRLGTVVDACTHLFCNRLGLSVQDEMYARHLVGRAVADLSEPTAPKG
ncbi:thiopeptide-type bacteriocin biosynthesis protein [Streptomyces sp. NPDC047028]|uniref:thiopeptide-type bacteriocin biosynthesis protein n=1 Tax=Streptomyces sp. NPDC047028 TaxID=3155793 RepID=UPI003411D14F